MGKDLWTRREMLALTGAAGLAALGIAAPRRAGGPSAYQQKDLAKRPGRYLRLGEFSGPTAVDETKHLQDGAYHGDLTYREAGAIRCDLNTAIKLDGRRSYVEVSDSKNFSQPTSGRGLTVEVWVRPDALVFEGETNDPHIHWLGKGVTGQYEWALRFYSRESTRPNRISAYIWHPSGGVDPCAYLQEEL